ncbi:MAG: hypothetical protein HY288_01020 [Planctomycetia bacterium]|nr:hypothetical protein [Planctomycetia bacterium]
MKTLRDYTSEQAKWITFVESQYFPDSMVAGIPIYHPIIQKFGEFLSQARDSKDLLKRISDASPQSLRIQLLRVFRKYVSPDTSVEMLKKKSKIPEIITEFGSRFRELDRVRRFHSDRPQPDEALIAILNEYWERGSKGYALTGLFFEWFAINFGGFDITGPAGAGKDINLFDIVPDYPKDRRPVDFVIKKTKGRQPLVVGLARYDSDRGGAQEDDRTSGYRNVVAEIMGHKWKGKTPKVLFINDGPGLLLGSMWKDYCELEDS